MPRAALPVVLAALAQLASSQQQRVPPPQAATRPSPQEMKPVWKPVFYHDEDDSSLALHDVLWPAPDCAIALGWLNTRNKPRPVMMQSRDGGVNWTMKTLKDGGRSAFFLPTGRLGWLVTESGLSRTSDCGETWEPTGKLKNVTRVFFLDESRGFAAGLGMKAHRTTDGGRTWTQVKPEDEPKADPDRSAYTWIDFANDKSGIIVGAHQPERPPQRPAWMDPESAKLRYQWPALTLMLQTIDGGAHWKGFTSSLMGRMTRVRMTSNGVGLALMEFEAGFEWPAEVFEIDTARNHTERVFREKNRAITDVAVTAAGRYYLAGTEPAGPMRDLPIPGKVKILVSFDRKLWQEMPVDYRAAANRVYLAAGPGLALLAATDTGMILALR